MANDGPATAWLPFDAVNGQTADALALAIEWIERECVAHHAIGLLITQRKSLDLYADPIQDFARRHAWTSRRGVIAGKARSAGPVLVHCPGFEELDYAELTTHNSSVCATEWPDVPLTGWAAARGALDLRTDEVTPPPSDEAAKLFEDLHFAGNNGWLDGPGKRDAKRLIAELASAAPELDSSYIAAYMLGVGNVSAQSVEHLRAMAIKAGR